MSLLVTSILVENGAVPGKPAASTACRSSDASTQPLMGSRSHESTGTKGPQRQKLNLHQRHASRHGVLTSGRWGREPQLLKMYNIVLSLLPPGWYLGVIFNEV
ncbi:hypothetical protein U0070_010803 [Myodes glareolus]|uniref:Uncharacterized protein n=1 Tax=Myodes glareolus TaxID=447135 RepID=A0AAW0H467_MYOGA